MEKGDPPSTGSAAGCVVHQLESGGSARCQGRVQVGDAIAEMMDAGAPPGEESGDRAVGVAGAQQLDGAFPEWQRQDGGAVGLFQGTGRYAEDIAIEPGRLLEIGDRDADVGQARWL